MQDRGSPFHCETVETLRMAYRWQMEGDTSAWALDTETNGLNPYAPDARLVLVQAVMPGLFDTHAPSMAISIAPLERALASPRVGDSVLHSFELAAAARDALAAAA